MKLYIVDFEKEQDFMAVKAAAKIGDLGAVVYMNEDSAFKTFEFQSKAAADSVVKIIGGELRVIDYNIKDILK